MSDTDDIFLKRFSMVIAGLVAFTFVILFIADIVAQPPKDDSNPSRVTLTNDRTLPEGGVRTELSEDTMGTSMAAAAPAEAVAMSGADVYASACQACHMTGAAGAPIPGSDDWAQRAEQGLATLADHAINGINAMPANHRNIARALVIARRT